MFFIMSYNFGCHHNYKVLKNLLTINGTVLIIELNPKGWRNVIKR